MLRIAGRNKEDDKVEECEVEERERESATKGKEDARCRWSVVLRRATVEGGGATLRGAGVARGGRWWWCDTRIKGERARENWGFFGFLWVTFSSELLTENSD